MNYFAIFYLLAGQISAIYWTYNSSILNLCLSNHKYTNLIITPNNINEIYVGLKVVFYVHGWLDNATSPSGQPAEDAILSRNDSHFIKVNWGPLANVIFYANAAYNVNPVGENVGDFISELFVLGHNLSMVHLNGFSLGAHVAGKAGNRVIANLGKSIFRITGLDPAGPLFYLYPTANIDYILQASDAIFVDILHTSAGYIGTNQSLGTVNFYANCGTLQPGCVYKSSYIDSIPIDNINSNTLACSHQRALHLWMESIVSSNFLANSNQSIEKRNCLSTVQFGYDVDTSISGLFYFNTSAKPPFALGSIGECVICNS